MQIAFYEVVQEVANCETREMSVKVIPTAFRTKYRFGGSKYEGRLALKSFKISSEPSPATDDGESDHGADERRLFDGMTMVDGVFRVARGDGNGPLSALLGALRSHLDLDFSIRKYSEHFVGEGSAVKAASYVEIVRSGQEVKEARKTSESWWGVGAYCWIWFTCDAQCGQHPRSATVLFPS
jgi:2-isopropylmalate synthase